MEKKARITAAAIVAAAFAAAMAALPSHATAGATLFLFPVKSTAAIGSTFTLSVYVSSPGAAMNAAQGVIAFPNDKLSVVSVSKEDSILTLWPENPSYSNINGTVAFQGVVVNPGFEGQAGKIMDIVFKVKNTGAAAISFASGSVLANDGSGTSILDGMRGASVSLIPASLIPAVVQESDLPSSTAVASTADAASASSSASSPADAAISATPIVASNALPSSPPQASVQDNITSPQTLPFFLWFAAAGMVFVFILIASFTTAILWHRHTRKELALIQEELHQNIERPESSMSPQPAPPPLPPY